MKIFRKILLALGLICLILTLAAFVAEFSYLSKSNQTTGKIKEVLTRKSGTEYTSSASGSEFPCKLIIEFQYIGKQILFTTLGEREPCGPLLSFANYYHAGNIVEIIFNPSNPQDAKVSDLFDIYGFTLLFGAGGIFFIGVGIFLQKLFSKSTRK